jgi:hypothetical protein
MHPRKYSHVGAVYVRSKQRMSFMTPLLFIGGGYLFLLPPIKWFISMASSKPDHNLTVLDSFHQTVDTPLFWGMGVGDIYFFVTFITPWILYMYGQMGTEWETFYSERTLKSIERGKEFWAWFWANKWVHDAYFWANFICIYFPKGMLLLNLMLKGMLRTWRFFSPPTAVQEPRVTAPESKPAQGDDAMLAKPSHAIITPVARPEKRGGIDLNLENYNIKFNHIPLYSNGLNIFPQDLEGFRFNIVKIAPFILRPDEFFAQSPVSRV